MFDPLVQNSDQQEAGSARSLDSEEHTLDEQLREFRRSLTPDLFTLTDFIDWDRINDDLERLMPGVVQLQTLVDTGGRMPEDLARVLNEEPSTLEVLRTLVAASLTVGFFDGRELSQNAPMNDSDATTLALLLVDLGV